MCVFVREREREREENVGKGGQVRQSDPNIKREREKREEDK